VRAQLLGERGEGSARSAADVVSRVVGVQAQDSAAAALTIRARTSGLEAADVDAAVGGQGSLVLTWSLRGTRHLHRRDDVRWLVGLLGPKYARPGHRARQLGIAGEAGDSAVRVVRDALASEGPVERRELKERLATHGVDPSGQAVIHVLRRAALEGMVCVLPGPGRRERFVLVDDVIDPAPPIDPDQAAVLLVRRYLTAFAPASPTDFAVWSGLGAGVVRKAWSALGAELTEVEVPGGRSWLSTGQLDDLMTAADAPAPLRLLGGFDTLLLGYDDRSGHVDPEHSRRVNAGGGLIRPTVLVDGRVVGTWAFRRSRRPLQVEVSAFAPMGGADAGAIEVEALDVGRFFGTGPPATSVSVAS